MPPLTEEELTGHFCDRTYRRGLDYYENGHVLKPVRNGDELSAQVIGTTVEPYEVEAEIGDEGDVYTSCTCPVGGMCKHGVALLLKWVREPESFVDIGEIFQGLEKKGKAELLKMIKNAISEHPELIEELELRPRSHRDTSHISAEKYLARIDDILDERDPYDETTLALLDGVRDTADDLRDDRRYADAAKLYLKLADAARYMLDSADESEKMDEAVERFLKRVTRRFKEVAPRVDRHASRKNPSPVR
jgi:uncharacterized Zn finger protein